MKRNWKSLMVSGTVLTVLAGALTLPALASVGQRTAALHYQNIKVTLDGRTLDLTDSRGNEVEPFTIDGRPICRWLPSARRWEWTCGGMPTPTL